MAVALSSRQIGYARQLCRTRICVKRSSAVRTRGAPEQCCSSGLKAPLHWRPKMLKTNQGMTGKADVMAKGQVRSNKEARKPKAKAPKKTNASNTSRKISGIGKA